MNVSNEQYREGHRVRCIGCTALALGLVLSSGCGGKNPAEATPEQIMTAPITLYLKIDGGFYVLNDAWHFYLDSRKGAWLTILRYPHDEQRELDISKKQIKALREALVKENYFKLREEYGIDRKSDLGIRGLRISAGGTLLSVSIHPLEEDWETFDEETQEEIRRALRIWRIVRSWFDAPSIVDYRESDAAILDSD